MRLPTSTRRLIAFATAVFWLTGSIAPSPADDAKDLPTLQIHLIRCVDPAPLIAKIESIVAEDRFIFNPDHRQMIVFASTSIQQSVAEAITIFEQESLLLDRIALDGAPPELVQRLIDVWIRSAAVAAKSPTDQPKKITGEFKYQIRAGEIHVVGRKHHINFVKESVAALNQSRQSVAPVGQGNPKAQDDQADQRDVASTDRTRRVVDRNVVESADEGSDVILAPRGPVRIVPIKGLDLLLIRGKQSDVGRVAPAED